MRGRILVKRGGGYGQSRRRLVFHSLWADEERAVRIEMGMMLDANFVLQARKKKKLEQMKLKERPQKLSTGPDTPIISCPRAAGGAETEKEGRHHIGGGRGIRGWNKVAGRAGRTNVGVTGCLTPCWLLAKARKSEITRRKYRFRLFASTVEIPGSLTEDADRSAIIVILEINYNCEHS